MKRYYTDHERQYIYILQIYVFQLMERVAFVNKQTKKLKIIIKAVKIFYKGIFCKEFESLISLLIFPVKNFIAVSLKVVK